MNIREKDCRWDLVSLGAVMQRLDPRDNRIAITRTFHVWEGGGEYNVARGLKRCFRMDTTVVTALADNPVGRLVQDLIYQGGVDQSGGVRRCGTKVAQRFQLHRAWLWGAGWAVRIGDTPRFRNSAPAMRCREDDSYLELEKGFCRWQEEREATG